MISIWILQHPGNIAVDDVNGGRLIFYDFGMMGRYLWGFFASKHLTDGFLLERYHVFCNYIFILTFCSISPNIREGLLEVFYGVYEKDADKVIIFSNFLYRISFFFFKKFYLWTWDYVFVNKGKSLSSGVGPSSNDSNGCSCAYWRHDRC